MDPHLGGFFPALTLQGWAASRAREKGVISAPPCAHFQGNLSRVGEKLGCSVCLATSGETELLSVAGAGLTYREVCVRAPGFYSMSSSHVPSLEGLWVPHPQVCKFGGLGSISTPYQVRKETALPDRIIN